MFGNYHNLLDSLGRNRCRKVRAQESLLGDTFTRRQYNDRVLGEEGQENEPRRPRVVDKRVSSRTESTPDPGPSPEIRAEPEIPAEPAEPAEPPEQPEPATAGPPPSSDEEAPVPQSGPTQADPGVWTPEREAEAQTIAQELSQVPALDWVANAAVTLANVAAAKIQMGQAPDAQLAIDALGALLDGLGSRFGEAEQPLKQTLAQLRFAYAQAVMPPGEPGAST
jgi:hypothetical protein